MSHRVHWTEVSPGKDAREAHIIIEDAPSKAAAIAQFLFARPDLERSAVIRAVFIPE
jgi:hypothetical protein